MDAFGTSGTGGTTRVGAASRSRPVDVLPEATARTTGPVFGVVGGVVRETGYTGLAMAATFVPIRPAAALVRTEAIRGLGREIARVLAPTSTAVPTASAVAYVRRGAGNARTGLGSPSPSTTASAAQGRSAVVVATSSRHVG